MHRPARLTGLLLPTLLRYTEPCSSPHGCLWMQRRVYKLNSEPNLRLLHYHRAPPGGRTKKPVKRKAPEAGGAGQAAPKAPAA